MPCRCSLIPDSENQAHLSFLETAFLEMFGVDQFKTAFVLLRLLLSSAIFSHENKQASRILRILFDAGSAHLKIQDQNWMSGTGRAGSLVWVLSSHYLVFFFLRLSRRRERPTDAASYTNLRVICSPDIKETHSPVLGCYFTSVRFGSVQFS